MPVRTSLDSSSGDLAVKRKGKKMVQGVKIAWWSAGITSAVACKIALEMYADVELYYIGIDTAHEDNERFKKDCEKWYGREIKRVKSHKFNNQFEVIEKTGMINSVNGAACTSKLKGDVRRALEKQYSLTIFNNTVIDNQIWGFEFDIKQVNRAIRFGRQHKETNPLFPLIEKGITKDQCAGMLINAGIELPEMYKLGFSNNNCIGCVKGGKWYWNNIRKHFPKIFEKMANLEKETGYSCINGTFLKDLKPNQGRKNKELIPSCGVICEVELGELPDQSLESVLKGEIDIYEAIKRGKI